ncbi:MAG: RNA polymerase subunit sigma [Planctomycetaceae bacterium]
MSGPIVRTGTTPEFWKNWDQVFGGAAKTESSATPKAAKKSAAKKAATPEKVAKKSAKKAAKKK